MRSKELAIVIQNPANGRTFDWVGIYDIDKTVLRLCLVDLFKEPRIIPEDFKDQTTYVWTLIRTRER